MSIKNLFFFLSAVALVAGIAVAAEQKTIKITTKRGTPYFLAVSSSGVVDTCPGRDIYKRFTCTKEQYEGYSCVDAYMLGGSPPAEHRYELIEEKLTRQAISAEPQCPVMKAATCQDFLEQLNYAIEFTWYIRDFPTKPFEQCTQPYDCRRLVCYFPTKTETVETSMQLSCVFKGNRNYFVGTQITCGRE